MIMIVHVGPCVNVSTPCPDSAEGPQFLSTFCNERRSSTIPGPDQMPVTEFWPYANVSQNDVPYLHSENTDICFDGTANYTNIQYVIERCNYILQSLCPLCGGNQLLFRGRIVPQVTNCKIVPSQCQTGRRNCW